MNLCIRKNLDLEVNPLANDCLGSSEMRTEPKSKHFTVDLSQGIPKKQWEICVQSIHLVDKYGNKISVDSKQAALEINQCKTKELQIHYSLYGGKEHSRTLFVLKDVHQLGTDVQVIDDCDLFEKELNVAIDKIINRPGCSQRTLVKVGRITNSKSWKTRIGQSSEKVRNPLKDTEENAQQNRCLKTSVTASAEVDGSKFSTTFDLDPMKCFNSDAELKFKEGETNTIFVNLTEGIAFNEKLFDTCLTGINIYDQDKMKVPFEEMAEDFHRIKITTLNRLRNQSLMVEYNFEGRMKKTKILTVPSSPMMIQQESERVNLIQTVTLAGVVAGGSLVVVIILVALICFLRTRVKSDEQPAFYTDENDIYGTYERGWDGEGDYGDGDVVEVVDINHLYGHVID